MARGPLAPNAVVSSLPRNTVFPLFLIHDMTLFFAFTASKVLDEAMLCVQGEEKRKRERETERSSQE